MDEETDLQTGNRILSVYMYLNDVEEGGETIFPELDLVVSPEVGKVIIWPNVLNDKPTEMDGRTIYEAKPVIAGSKYGANVWFRYRPIQSAWREPICNDNDEDDQSHTEELDALKTEL
jgi:prolyl 4-hydroxylase